MIVLNEKKNSVNYLHIIIGPETEFQFNLNGHSSIDISEYIKDLPRNEKFVVLVNRCDSEDDVLRQLAIEQSRIQFQKAVNESVKRFPFPKNLSNENDENDEDEEDEHLKKEKMPRSDGHSTRCPKCGKPGYYNILDGVIESCDLCKKTDSLKDIPPVPTPEELRKLRQDLIDGDKKKKNKPEEGELDG